MNKTRVYKNPPKNLFFVSNSTNIKRAEVIAEDYNAKIYAIYVNQYGSRL